MSFTPLRIAFVSLHTSPADLPGSGDAGGMNVVEWHQARALATLGHHVEMITRAASEDAPAEMDLGDGVLLRHIAVGPPRRIAKSAQEEFIEPFSRALAELGPYDVLFSQHWMSGMAALPVARRWGIPHVQSFHSVAAPAGAELSEGEPPESAGRIAAEALLAQRSDLVITVSKAEASSVVHRCGADPANVLVLLPGVDLDMFRPLEPGESPWTPPGGAPEHGYVVFAGRLQPLKAPDLAIEAMAALPAKNRPHLIVVGEVSQDFAAYHDDIEKLIDDLDMRDYVRLVGPQSREELATTLRGALLSLMTSHSETFGLVTIEAAASGVPTVAAASGGLRESVADGRSGVLLESRDPTVWAETIATLLADPAARAALGWQARRYALGFNWSAVGERLEAIFAEVTARSIASTA